MISGGILQVTIHGDNGIPVRVSQARGKRCLVPEIAGQIDQDETVIRRRTLRDELRGCVPAAIIDEDRVELILRLAIEQSMETLE